MFLILDMFGERTRSISLPDSTWNSLGQMKF